VEEIVKGIEGKFELKKKFGENLENLVKIIVNRFGNDLELNFD
jgi:hypothetical protein